MATIKVKYRPSTIPDHVGSIYYQIGHARKVRLINTNYRVMPGEWDESRSMVVTKESSERKHIILSIREEIRCDVERVTRIDRRLAAAGHTYTADDVVAEFKRYSAEYTLFNYITSLIRKFKDNSRPRLAETYTSALNSFRKFRNGNDLMIDRITPEIMESFEAWHKQRGNTPNTISFYMRILRAVYRRAIDETIITDRHPFRRVYTGVDKTVKRAIQLDCVKQIKALALSPKLAYARDMFLLSFYLRGMSFIDMAYLKKTDLHNGHITYRRRKTGQLLTIQWTPQMQAILDRYPENPTQYLLPIIKKPGLNERCAYRNASYRINRNLKKIAEIASLPIPLTMYVARHSWASAARTKGIPLSVISEGMGHDSESTTQIYLASLDTSAIDRANALIIDSI